MPDQKKILIFNWPSCSFSEKYLPFKVETIYSSSSKVILPKMKNSGKYSFLKGKSFLNLKLFPSEAELISSQIELIPLEWEALYEVTS